MSFIAGPSTSTYDTSTLGQIEDGYDLEWVTFADEIRGDNFAQALQEIIYRGTDAAINYIMLEYNQAGAQKAFWPYHATFGTMGQVGRIVASGIGASAALAKSLVLTAVAGTTAAAVPATLTGARTILAPGFPIRTLFGNRLRRLPLRQILLPDSSGILLATT